MSKENAIARINLELPDAMKRDLQRVAKAQGETVSTVIRSILRNDLNKILIPDKKPWTTKLQIQLVEERIMWR